MRTARQGISHKHFQLDSGKIRRAQRVLRAKTETETIERALDAVLAEHKRNQLVAAAHERFVASGITVKDVFGKLAE
jgi:ribosomal protein S4